MNSRLCNKTANFFWLDKFSNRHDIEFFGKGDDGLFMRVERYVFDERLFCDIKKMIRSDDFALFIDETDKALVFSVFVYYC